MSSSNSQVIHHDLDTLPPWQLALVLAPVDLPATPASPCHHCGEDLFWLKAWAECGKPIFRWVCLSCNCKPLDLRIRITLARSATAAMTFLAKTNTSPSGRSGGLERPNPCEIRAYRKK